MARRARSRRGDAVLGDAMATAAAGERAGGDAERAINVMLCAQIMEKIDREPIYNLTAPQTLPIKQFDGSYRQRPIAADEEFTFKGCRIGARQQVIFEFQPMDPTKFDQLELEEKNVFTSFEGFEKAACAALDGATSLGGDTWPARKKGWFFREKGRRRQEAIDAETAAQKEVDDAYGSNSAFGTW
jgi:hypothetical protein